MAHLKAACLFAAVQLAACSDKNAPDDVANGGVVRLDIAPNALLLAHPGEQQTLTVIAYDAAGQPIEPDAAITWTSSHPNVVAVSDAGEVIASELIGSSQIAARLGSIDATPVTIVVAHAVTEALLVTDAQIASALRPTGGLAFDVTLRDVPTLTVGSVVLACESTPLAGRVTAIADVGGGASDVSLVAVNLDEAFTALKIDESFSVPSPSRVTTAARRPGGTLEQALESEFEYGIFECEASVEPPLEIGVPFKLDLEPTIDLDFVLDLEQGVLAHHRVVAKGGLALSPSGALELTAAFAGELECEVEAMKFVIPIGGALSFFIAPTVPIGMGFKVEAGIQAAQLRFGLGGKLGATVTGGYDWTPGDGLTLVRDFQPIAELEPIIEYPGSLTEDLRVKLGVQAYGFAKLAIAVFPQLPGDRSIEAFELTGGPQIEFDYGTESAQATDAAYASAYGVKLAASAGLADDITDLFEVLGGAVAFKPPEFTLELGLAESPSGTLVASAQTAEAGETVTFTVNIAEGDTFFTVHNIAQASVHELKSDGTLRQISEVYGAEGQTSFQMQWIPTEAEAGSHDFVAFVRPAFMGVDALPRLEVAPDSRVNVNVHVPGQQPTDLPPGIHTFYYSGTSNCLAGPAHSFWFFPNGAVAGSAANWGTCVNSLEQQFKVPFGSWTTDPGDQSVVIDFCNWPGTDGAVSFIWNPARMLYEGDYSIYNPGYTACIVPGTPGIGSFCVAGNTCVQISTATCNGTPIAPYTLTCLNGQSCCYEECPSGGVAPWIDQLEVTCFPP